MEKELIKVSINDEDPMDIKMHVTCNSENDSLLISGILACIELLSKRSGLSNEKLLEMFEKINEETEREEETR